MAELAKNALIKLEDLKVWLGIPADDTEYDKLLTLIINSVSSWIEAIIGRPLGLARHLDKIKGYDMQKIMLRYFPIREIYSIVDIQTGNAFEPSLYDFSQEGNIGVVYKDNMFRARGYRRGLVPYRHPLSRYINVDYHAGYVLPADFDEDYPKEWHLPAVIMQIVMEKAALMFSAADMGGQDLASFGISDVSWSFNTEDKQEWLDVLAGFKEL